MKEKIKQLEENRKEIVKKAKNSRLVNRIVPIIALVIFVLYMGQSFILAKKTKKQIRIDSVEQYETLSNTYADLLEERIGKFSLGLDRYVQSAVAQTAGDEEIIEWLQNNISLRDQFDYVGYVDLSGTFYADNGSTANVVDREYCQAIVKKGQDFYIDNPSVSRTNGKMIIHINKAVRQNGKLVGFFSGVLTMENFKHILEGCNSGETGCAVLFSDKREIMSTSGNEDHVKKVLNGNILEQGICKKENGREITSSWVFTGEGEVLFCETKVSGTTWGVGFMINKKEVMKLGSDIGKLMAVACLIILLVMIVVLSMLIIYALKPLQIVENTITGIASGEGDLTQRIELKKNSHNEVGRIVDGFNNFSEKLREIISATKESKDMLVVAGDNLAATTQDTAASITEILANIQSMESNINRQSGSVTETAGAVNQIASNIESLNRMIECQVTSITQASSAIEEMIGNINSVNSSVNMMAASFEELEASVRDGVAKQNEVNDKIQIIESESESLKEANAVISSIAEQTNLLAMNAAIEAAHAGEAGKGFSVVADEIRKLSETSSDQSKTIGDQLAKITSNISQMVLVSQDAAYAFENVSSGINSTSTLVQQIKGAMFEQEEGSKQISISLSEMNDSSFNVRTAAQEMESGNKAILDEIKNLQESTFIMKSGMEEMSIGADRINRSGADLKELSDQMEHSILVIGEQVDRFKV